MASRISQQVVEVVTAPSTAATRLSQLAVEVILDTTLAITTASLADGTVGSAYSATVSSVGGTAPVSFAVTVGTLPDGLSLAAGGAITGTPTTAGTSDFTVTATDSAGSPATDTQALSIIIAAAEPEPDAGTSRLTPGSQGSPRTTTAADRVTDGTQGSPFVRGTYSATTRRVSGRQGSPITRSTS
jgi:hypothetical protein